MIHCLVPASYETGLISLTLYKIDGSTDSEPSAAKQFHADRPEKWGIINIGVYDSTEYQPSFLKTWTMRHYTR
jgi:hypothetical protein